MDTLPGDLHFLIKKPASIDEWILLGLSSDDNTKYLQEITPRRRMRLALKERHIGWINHYLATISTEQRPFIDIDYIIKYRINIIGLDYIESYICRKIAKYCNQRTYNIEWFVISSLLVNYNTDILHGLIKGNHIELFEHALGIGKIEHKNLNFCGHPIGKRPWMTMNYVASGMKAYILLDFEDQTYIIKLLSNIWDHVSIKYTLLDYACRKKKYQVVEFLLQRMQLNADDIFPSTIINLIIDGKEYFYLNRYIGNFEHSLEFYIALCCSLSITSVLDFLFRHKRDNKKFFKILKDHYINKEIFEYYQLKHKAHYSSGIPRQSEVRMMDISKYENLIALFKQYKPPTSDWIKVVVGQVSVERTLSIVGYNVLVYLFKNSDTNTIKMFLNNLISVDTKILEGFINSIIDMHQTRSINPNWFNFGILNKLSIYIKSNNIQLIFELEKFRLTISSEATRIELLSLLIDNLY